jgi:hypothetical protein
MRANATMMIAAVAISLLLGTILAACEMHRSSREGR